MSRSKKSAELSEAELADILSREQQYEKQAQRDAAWGAYSAHVRTTGYENQMAEYDRAVREAPNPAKRKEAEAARKEFLKKARSSTTLYVGGT